jgi:hypothetical protein
VAGTSTRASNSGIEGVLVRTLDGNVQAYFADALHKASLTTAMASTMAIPNDLMNILRDKVIQAFCDAKLNASYYREVWK